MKCSKSLRIPRPPIGGLTTLPRPLVTKGFLPWAIAASRLRRSQFDLLARSDRPVVHNLFRPGATSRVLKLFGGQIGLTTKPMSHDCMPTLRRMMCAVKEHGSQRRKLLRIGLKVLLYNSTACFSMTTLLTEPVVGLPHICNFSTSESFNPEVQCRS